MAVTRRSFIKIVGAAAGALLVSLGLQNATMDNIKAEHIPGAGHPPQGKRAGSGAGNENQEDTTYKTRVDNIDASAFLAGCSRCGVCIQKCPFQAIKSESLAVPQLTNVTAAKCPGV